MQNNLADGPSSRLVSYGRGTTAVLRALTRARGGGSVLLLKPAAGHESQLSQSNSFQARPLPGWHSPGQAPTSRGDLP